MPLFNGSSDPPKFWYQAGVCTGKHESTFYLASDAFRSCRQTKRCRGEPEFATRIGFLDCFRPHCVPTPHRTASNLSPNLVRHPSKYTLPFIRRRTLSEAAGRPNAAGENLNSRLAQQYRASPHLIQPLKCSQYPCTSTQNDIVRLRGLQMGLGAHLTPHTCISMPNHCCQLMFTQT